MKKRKLLIALAVVPLLTVGAALASCNNNPTPDPVDPVDPDKPDPDKPDPDKPDPTPTPTEPSMVANKDSIVLDELGKSEEVKLTLTNITGVPTWESTSTNIQLDVSADGLTCKITNLKGARAIVTVSLEGVDDIDISVKASTYGDTRLEYSIYKADGTKLGDYKGFFNAIDVLESDLANNGGYITLKDSEDKIYTFSSNTFLNAVTRTGTSQEFAGQGGFDENGKSGWFANWHAGCVDASKETYVFNTLLNDDGSKRDSYHLMETMAYNADKDLFADGNAGYSDAGKPTNNLWSGFRQGNYISGGPGIRYISWADPYEWDTAELNFDLSKSKLIPSFNSEQESEAIIYLGSCHNIQEVYGVYFDAGSIETNASLADGYERDIYTYSEPIVLDGSMINHRGTRTIGTTSIGKAKWNSFDKVWEFPDVKVSLYVDMKFSDDYDKDASGNYVRDYTITGYKGDEVVNEVKYQANKGAAVARGGSSERTVYGVSLTTKYENGHIMDLTNGSEWTGIYQIESTATQVPGASKEEADNLSWCAGRAVNFGNQTFIMGRDMVTTNYNSDGYSVIDISYKV